MLSRLLNRLKLPNPVPPQERWPLASTLFNLGAKQDPFTIGESVEGVFIAGETGAGKSSSTGQALALAYLRAGYGALVLTVKPDEARNWERYCALSGRESDLRIFSATSGHRLNFLEWEAKHGGVGAGETENLVTLLTEAAQVLNRASKGSGDGSEEGGFWKNNETRLTRNEVQTLQLAGLPITVSNLYRVLSEAPQSAEEAASESFQKRSFTFHCLKLADQRPKSERERHDLGVVADWWLSEFPKMSPKTRSVIVASQMAVLDILNRGIVRELMCEETTLSPLDIMDGKVVVVDLNLKQWGAVGALCQSIWKLLYQRCVERRDVAANPRPVLLYVDECQHLLVPGTDSLFQTTARSSRCATVYLTQGLPALHTALGGGEQGKSETATLLGNMALKFFHANSCSVTNEYASTLIGRKKQWVANVSSSQPRSGFVGSMTGMNQSQDSAGCSEVFEYEFPPHQFATLRSGGFENHRLVDAIVYRGKRLFRSTGCNWRHLSILQG